MNIDTRPSKIMQQLEQLSKISSTRDSITRMYLTPQHQQANTLIGLWMKQARLDTWQDSVGNRWGRKLSSNPTLPTLIIGSHSDTVVNAGKYDGLLGITLAIEALYALSNESFPFNIDIVAFADEEGARFDTTLLGSSAVAGNWNPDFLALKDNSGISMGDAMRHFDLMPSLAGNDKRAAKDVQAYLEVHIEQGPILDNNDLPVGVVNAIAGVERFSVSVMGTAGHAGTVPIHLRNDALCGTAEMVIAVESFSKKHDIVATIGKCDMPNSAVNVIPNRVNFTLDVRCHEQGTLERLSQELLIILGDIAKKRHLGLTHDYIYRANAVSCNEALQKKWGNIVQLQTQKEVCYLTSGAGHDAINMATITDISMLFVRCKQGISHNPKEHVEVADVEVALNCLIDMIRSIAQDVSEQVA